VGFFTENGIFLEGEMGQTFQTACQHWNAGGSQIWDNVGLRAKLEVSIMASIYI